jgi:hypothetical protein
MTTLNGREVVDIEIDGVDLNDYPDLCDAYFSYARFDDDGSELTDAELDELAMENPELVHELALGL